MWMKATEGADGTTFYIDRDSIKKEGKLLRVWELQDLKEKGPLDEKSRRVLVEYDCKDERRRVMSFTFHADQMGAGLTLKSDQTPGKWNLMVPNTTGSVVYQVATALKASTLCKIISNLKAFKASPSFFILFFDSLPFEKTSSPSLRGTLTRLIFL